MNTRVCARALADVDGRLMPTRMGFAYFLAFAFALMLTLVVFFGMRFGPDGAIAAGVPAGTLLWQPTARAVFGMLGIYHVNLWGTGGLLGPSARADVKLITDAAVTGGTNVLSSPTYVFVAADKNKPITIPSAGATSYVWAGTIADVVGGNAILSSNTVTTVAGGKAWWGTDDTAAGQAAIDAAAAAGGGMVVFRNGSKYLIGSLTPKDKVHVSMYGATLYRNGNETKGLFTNSTTQLPLTGFKMLGGELIGEGRDQGPAFQAGLARCWASLYNVTDLEVRDVVARDWTSQGIGVSDWKGVRYDNVRQYNVCTAAAGNAFHLGIQKAGLQDSVGFLPIGTGAEIRGCHVEGCMTAGICIQTSFDYNSAANYEPQRVRIFGGYYQSGAFSALALECGRIAGTGTTSQGSVIRGVQVFGGIYKQTAAAGSGCFAFSASDNNSGGVSESTDPTQFQDVELHGVKLISSDGGASYGGSDLVVIGGICEAATVGWKVFPTLTGNSPANHLFSATRVRMTAAGAAFNFSTTTGTTVTGGTMITYPGGGVLTTAGDAIHLSSCSKWKIGDVRIDNAPGNGVQWVTCGEGTVDGTVVFNCSDAGSGQGSAFYFNNCTTTSITRIFVKGFEAIDEPTGVNGRTATFMAYGVRHNGGTPNLSITDGDIFGSVTAPTTTGAGIRRIASIRTNYGGSWPMAKTAIAPGATGTTAYTNLDTFDEVINISGGAVTAIAIAGQGSGNTSTLTGAALSGQFRLPQNHTITLTWTAGSPPTTLDKAVAL